MVDNDHHARRGMKRKGKLFVVLAFVFALLTIGQIALRGLAQPASPANPAQARIQKEVRHELLMLPYFTVFDNIAFRVEAETVTLLGDVTRPVLKSDAENAVKQIEGVEQVVNKINVLPPAPMDSQSRVALYRSIYGFPALEKYAMGVQKPIRIVVNMGKVTLEGVVDSQADKDMVGLRANTVPGIFSVTNNLQVEQQ
jgi:hyperosmotically inducible protein